MTTDNYIKENKTETFKKGDKVLMHSCIEANEKDHKGKVWECKTDSFLSKSNSDVVFLNGFSGYFYTKYLQIVKF